MTFAAGIVIRDQAEGDFASIHAVVEAAFKTAAHTCGREQFILDALWRTGAATVALVAEETGAIIGQTAFSKVLVGGKNVGWHGCGPVSVLPGRQKQGIGSTLMRAGLERLRALGSKGCVVVGDPNYYRRFGFAGTSLMVAPGVGSEYFMAQSFGEAMPRGPVAFDPAFTAAMKE